MIACFVIAIFGLVPLRFVEVANGRMQMVERQQILGATTENEKKTETDLTKRCLNSEEVLKRIDEIQQKINMGNLREEELDRLLVEVREINRVRCN